MAITLRTDKQGLKIVDTARKKKNWTALSAAWCEEAKVSVSTLKRFREKTAIQKDAFISICAAAGVKDWDRVVFDSDPSCPPVKRRNRQAQKFIAEDVLAKLNNLEARLYFVEQSLLQGTLEQQAQALQVQVAPAFAQDISCQLMMQQRVSDLRQAFNSRPLSLEINSSTVQEVLAGEADPLWIQSFYGRLTDVQDASESLLKAMLALATGAAMRPRQHLHYQKQLDLEHRRLLGCATIAHLCGLFLLNTFNVESLNVANRLAGLRYLKPNHLDCEADLIQKLTQQKQAMQQILEESAALIVEKEDILKAQLSTYQRINRQLVIGPADTWGAVISKATLLRQLGRQSEAIAAFKAYGQMFAPQDPTALPYATTAQAFTQQIDDLGVTGGLYVYELITGGPAMKAGIPIGAIIIAYGDRTVKTVEDWAAAQALIPDGDPTRITYLQEGKHHFVRITQRILGRPIGAGLMPI